MLVVSGIYPILKRGLIGIVMSGDIKKIDFVRTVWEKKGITLTREPDGRFLANTLNNYMSVYTLRIVQELINEAIGR
jgi:hypothetical protein